MKLSLDRHAFAKASTALTRVMSADPFPISHNCLQVLAQPTGAVSLVAENFSLRASWRVGRVTTPPYGKTTALMRRDDCLRILAAIGDEADGAITIDLDEATVAWEAAGGTCRRAFEPVRGLLLRLADHTAAALGGRFGSVRLRMSSLADVMSLFDAARPGECRGAPLTFRFRGAAHEPVRVTCPYAPELDVLLRPARAIDAEATAPAAVS